VRFAYAGESTIDKRRVVKDEGSELNESVNEDSDADLGLWASDPSLSISDENFSMSRRFNSSSCWRSLPIPMLLCGQ
jgi:hypothetical protein